MLFSNYFANKHKLYYRKPDAEISDLFTVKEIGFNSVPPSLKQLHTRNIYIIHYVLSGKGYFMGKPFSPGYCYYVVEGEAEVVEAARDSSYESAWVMLRGRRAKELLTKCGFPEHNGVFPFDRAEECGNIIKEYLFDTEYENGYTEACKLEEVFYRLMAIHFESKGEEPGKNLSKAFEIAEYIEKNYSSPLKISDLCSIFYLSKNYLCTIFKREYGVTPQEYLISYRMEKARELLLLGSKPQIAEISFSVGIDNPLYFSRCFRARYGMSPSEYRKAQGKANSPTNPNLKQKCCVEARHSTFSF